MTHPGNVLGPWGGAHIPPGINVRLYDTENDKLCLQNERGPPRILPSAPSSLFDCVGEGCVNLLSVNLSVVCAQFMMLDFSSDVKYLFG